MGTTETIIVFSALMALIALVSVGIDWIGKPLKHRRFVPRIYRFEDEKLPTDAYGNAMLETQAGQAAHTVGAYIQPLPIVVATVAGAHMPMAPVPVPVAPLIPAAAAMATATIQIKAPLQAATAAPAATATAAASSAFSDMVSKPAPSAPGRTATASHTFEGDLDDWLATGPGPQPSSPPADDPGPATAWAPGLPLDTTVNDRKPNLATKAQRFWMATAHSLEGDHHESHFDTENSARMASGKAPRRNNPRTGRTESMQLTGLRQASQPDQVHMRWPNESVDPWNAT